MRARSNSHKQTNTIKEKINGRWSDGVNEGFECTIAITDLKLLETDESRCEHYDLTLPKL